MENCVGQKPCSSEEYEFHLGKDWSARDPSRAQNILQKILGNQTLLNKLLDRFDNTYVFILEFAKSKWSNGPYAMEVQKYVHKEYLAWTGTSLIGNVGGQLGLWVGFSFTGFLAQTLNFCPKMWSVISRNQMLQRMVKRKKELQQYDVEANIGPGN